MGADMIVTVIAVKRGSQPDLDAGEKFLRALTVTPNLCDDLYNEGVIDDDQYATDANGATLTNNKGEEIWDLTKVRTKLLERFDEFKNLIDSRETTWINVRDLSLCISGGMSWGDDTDFGYAVDAVSNVPGLLPAMGFVDWWEETP